MLILIDWFEVMLWKKNTLNVSSIIAELDEVLAEFECFGDAYRSLVCIRNDRQVFVDCQFWSLELIIPDTSLRAGPGKSFDRWLLPLFLRFSIVLP